VKPWDSHILSTILRPLSALYSLGMVVRSTLYRRGCIPTHRLNVPLISVGNLAAGGIGKTPMVAMLAKELSGRGLRVVISSRGYKRKHYQGEIVSDGETIHLPVEASGDEPAMLARRLTGVPIVVGRDRFRVCSRALSDLPCDVLILDDSFQHIRLHRDCDIVLLDANDLFGNGRLLPAGPLREPRSALKRADLIVLSRAEQEQDFPSMVSQISRWTDAPVVAFRHRPTSWVSHADGKVRRLDTLRGCRVAAFAGIGSPDSFRRTLKQVGVQIVWFQTYPDHHWYSPELLLSIFDRAKKAGAEVLVTTEKDGVRIPQRLAGDPSLYILKIDAEIIRGKNHLDRVLTRILNLD